MPPYDRDKILSLFRKLYPELWPSLTERDIDIHSIYCADLLSGEPMGGKRTKKLTQMVKRFRRTFDESRKNHE
ncbi:MAG TPA: hypothetical protein PLX18_11640 [Anaerohalosphaeraceae bacterium]|nr:hypothetical protein [Anaerohalosphaeraceae bacterium]HQI08495.1 hypothetical protein [Anaerohalosphaeraceae bacterium]HQJ68947.1 hypothetical protein [Anaerohalosphaeraceae bacterium]